MRNALLALLAGLILGGAGVWAWSAGRGGPAGGEPQGAEAEREQAGSFARRGPHGEVQVHLDAAGLELAGIQTASVRALELAPERRAYGRVVDPTPLAGLAFELVAARTAHAAAAKEERRVALLFRGQENASARELEVAQVALGQAQLGLDTARARLVASWGAALAERDDLDGLVRDLVAGRRALVRVDAPPGAPRRAQPEATRLAAFDAQTPLASAFLGPAPQTDPLLQGRGLLFVVEKDPPAPGTAVAAWLREPGAPVRGVEVPAAALLRHQGGVFVYVSVAPDTFERRAVELVQPTDAGWLATGSLAPGDPVVLAGAQLLLSTELQPQLEED